MDGSVAGKSVLGWLELRAKVEIRTGVKLLDDSLIVLHGSVVTE